MLRQARSDKTEHSGKLVEIPNTPHLDVPRGKTAADNLNVHQEGEMPKLPDNAMPHWDLLNKYQLADFELGNKVTGAGFPFYKGKGARLQRALINFFLDEAVSDGYFEVQPPVLVNEASAYATGQLPDKEAQMYAVPLDKMYLIPTAEVPVTNIFRDQIVQEAQLPIKTVAYSNCFRREAGSWGKTVRGLNRLHQFDKVEIVEIANPANSYERLEAMKAHVAGLLRKLELPFRVLRLCGGDMSFTSAMTYDFEVYSAAQQLWLEVSSVSNFETFQANRMRLRFKDKEGNINFVHTLNGSALALPRIVAALLENNQCAEGIRIPKALQNIPALRLLTNILCLLSVLSLLSCSDTPSKQVSSMQKRLAVVQSGVSTLYERDFDFLVKEYYRIDTTLARKSNISKEMDLLASYLQQFETVRVDMLDEIKYSEQQLSDLKYDIDNNKLSENDISKYLKDEEAAVKRLEAQLDYFRDRFSQQKKSSRT